MTRNTVVAARGTIAVGLSGLKVVLIFVVKHECDFALVLVNAMRNGAERGGAQRHEQDLRRRTQEPRRDTQHDAHFHRVSGRYERVKTARAPARATRRCRRRSRPSGQAALTSSILKLELRMTIRARLQILSTLAAVAALAVAANAGPQNASPQKPDHMQHRFDDPARFAKSFDDPARDQWQMPARVIEALGLQPNSSVADVGAGTGYFAMRLAKAVPKGTVYAVDVEPAMLEFLRKRAQTEHVSNVVTVQAAPASPNLPKPVDAFLIVNTYHHLPNRVTYFGELKRSLNKGGRVAIVDYRKDAPDGPPPEFRFEAAQITDEMQRAGYRLEAQHDFLPRQHFLVFRPE